MVPGIDVSHWQGEIDWSGVKSSGVRFAFIKATEFPDKRTKLYVDVRLYENVKGASENGIHWGAYHFFRTHIDAVIQAQAFVETVGKFTSLPPVLDLEAAGSKGEKLIYKVRQFLDEVQRLSGRAPIIYTSPGFWRGYMMLDNRTQLDWARPYPLWLAHYTSLWPSPLYPWAHWDFWQYTDHGLLPGIKTHVDMNWFMSTEAELISRFGVSNQAYHPPTSTSSAAAAKSIVDDTEAELEREFEAARQMGAHYRGDYQEPLPEEKRYFASGRRPNLHSLPRNPSSAHLQPSTDEMQWIRSYIIDKAVRQPEPN